jgi:hypothetical protein
MKTNVLAIAILAPLFATGGLITAHANGAPFAQPAYAQERGWDVPPPELREIQRQGFHDGIEGARKDVENNRRPDVDNRDEFRRPPVPPEGWEEYRDGFRRGYQLAMSHLMNGGPQMQPPPPPPAYDQDRDRGGWDAPPQEFREIQRQGFHDGIEGARKDVDNHRRPDVNNRDEYRQPPLPPGAWEEYREGFRRGYELAMSHLMNGGPPMPPPVMERPWDAPPDEFRDIARQGFHDGIEGARKDFDNHRRPDVNNRDEYRHPNVPREARDEYREGFRRGYELAVSRINNGQPIR